MIKPKDSAETEANNAYSVDKAESKLILWSDGSKLETGGVGAGIAWKRAGIWQVKGHPLGTTKEVFDAELYGIKQALDIAIRGLQPSKRSSQLSSYLCNQVIVFSDS